MRYINEAFKFQEASPMGVRMTITVREPIKKAIEKIAKKEDRSISDVASILIEKGLVVEGRMLK